MTSPAGRSSEAHAQPWRVGRGCVIVRVRATPKSSKDEVCGVEHAPDGPVFKVRVRAVPAEGEANAAIERLFAAWLGIPKSRVAVAQGGKSRIKSLEIAGEAGEIVERLARRLAAAV